MKSSLSTALGIKTAGIFTGGILTAAMLVHIHTVNSANTPGNGSQVGAPSIVQTALAIESHLTGTFLNSYDPNPNDTTDPVMQEAIAYWNSLPNDLAGSGHLQCAVFVETVYALAENAQGEKGKYKLPNTYNAVDYWYGYGKDINGKPRQGPDWQEIAVGTGLPRPGDLMVWSGGVPDPEDGYPDGVGHIQIVVAVQPPAAPATTPTSTQTPGSGDGLITVAQANGISNVTTAGIHLYHMLLLPDLRVPQSPGLKPAWNETALGYIRNNAAQNDGSGSSVVGPPTITANAHSPAAGLEQSMHDLSVKYNIDPVFALAFSSRKVRSGQRGRQPGLTRSATCAA